MIRAGVSGLHGKMGSLTAQTLTQAEGIEYVGGLVRRGTARGPNEYDDLEKFVAQAKPQVLVDFSLFPDSKRIVLDAIERGVRPVIGTSGYGADDLAGCIFASASPSPPARRWRCTHRRPCRG